MECADCGSQTPNDSDFCIMCGSALNAGGAQMRMNAAGPPGGMGEPPYGPGRRGEMPPPGPNEPYYEEPRGGQEPPKDRPVMETPEDRRMEATGPGYDNRAADGAWGSPIVGILTTIAGLVVFFMTWVPWVRGVTGYGLMATGSRAGNFLWRVESGRNIILFTGFWSLLAGVLLILGGVVMIFRHRTGGSIATAGGLIGTLVGIFNLIMVYRLGTAFSQTTGLSSIAPSVGLWIFTIVSAIALVHGILGIEGVDNPANDSLSARTMPERMYDTRYDRMRGAPG